MMRLLLVAGSVGEQPAYWFEPHQSILNHYQIFDPPTAVRDRTVKLDLYAQHGVKEYWIVDPDAKTIMVLQRGESRFEVSGIYGEGQTVSSPTLEGFSVALEEILQMTEEETGR